MMVLAKNSLVNWCTVLWWTLMIMNDCMSDTLLYKFNWQNVWQTFSLPNILLYGNGLNIYKINGWLKIPVLYNSWYSVADSNIRILHVVMCIIPVDHIPTVGFWTLFSFWALLLGCLMMVWAFVAPRWNPHQILAHH